MTLKFTKMSGFCRLRFLRMRKSGVWSGVKLLLLIVYVVFMIMLVMALFRKTTDIFGFAVVGDTQVVAEARVAGRVPAEVPAEVLKFEAQVKPGLGAHGQGVRLSDQSDKDIEDQLKVIQYMYIDDVSTILNIS